MRSELEFLIDIFERVTHQITLETFDTIDEQVLNIKLSDKACMHFFFKSGKLTDMFTEGV